MTVCGGWKKETNHRDRYSSYFHKPIIETVHSLRDRETASAEELASCLPHFYRMENILMRLTNKSWKKWSKKYITPSYFLALQLLLFFLLLFCRAKRWGENKNDKWMGKKGCNHNWLLAFHSSQPVSVGRYKDLN